MVWDAERDVREKSPSVHLFLEKAEEENEMPAHVRQTINESSCGKRECRGRKEGEEKYVTLLVDEHLSFAPFNHLPVDSSSSLRLNMNRREGRHSVENTENRKLSPQFPTLPSVFIVENEDETWIPTGIKGITKLAWTIQWCWWHRRKKV